MGENPGNNQIDSLYVWLEQTGLDKQGIPILFFFLVVSNKQNGAWPSGKATGFGPGDQRFESFRPSRRYFFISE